MKSSTKPTVIRVPDVPKPRATLCWKQGPSMYRCDRRTKHGGKHTWEYALNVDESATRK